MFRASDYPDPRPHPTYSRKPVPVMQRHSQAAQFDEFRNNEYPLKPNQIPGYQESSIPEAVPVTTDTVYDPYNPEADWSGYVTKKAQKRHTQGHISQKQGIMNTEYGLASITDDNIRKRIVRDTVSSHSLIGGLPDTESQWTSNYQRFSKQENTLSDQYTREKQRVPRHSLSEVPRVFEAPDFLSENVAHQSNTSTAHRNPTIYGSNSRTMISNIGSLIVDKLPEKDNSSVIGQRGRPSQTLITQNYKPHVPGYTGKRPVG